ncbi:RNA-binding protein [Pedobacter sp. HMF7647]|uniref:RNA-binding protein n=1 Tax=Hufsiella arboris TaxID=2695275 RepID=A0A7K1YD99_9SPHI|nr:VCBS repeat-containing protein [Hufsiella arboris]MXV52390.1 RNA-binding protein [Hufsiella arboris]
MNQIYNRINFACFFLLALICGCSGKKANTLFRLLPSSETGVTFTNTITESDTTNILNQANLYNGGGVGIGDFNNDGLPDMYFAGNMVSNKLYLNKGSLKFDDVTDAAGVGGEGRWCTGVSVVDINADGLLDIYVCTSFRKDVKRRTNLLYINQGVNKEGVPAFKESAQSYGLADTGYSTQAEFFDYDLDGDLDMYLVTNELNDPKTPIKFRPKVTDGSALNTDRLYQNNGNGTFTNVSKKAGIQIEGWGHSATISDFNMDGWPDVYVSNDFVANDLLYINNQDGTFTNRLSEYLKHAGWSAMGTDVVDVNNDGLPDIMSLEMLPEKNLRKKEMIGGDEYFNYFNAKRFGYEHQYVRNVLQLNSGMTPDKHPVFNDIGYMAGVYETDWSWTPLVADFDNDGLRDLIITNGLPRDVTNLDYIEYNSGQGGGKADLSLKMVDSLPVVKIANYAFKNTANGYNFQNQTQAWGFDKPAFSNGAAYADLDNDGDLDVVINNINDESFVYENQLSKIKPGDHFLTVSFKGEGLNTQGYGAKVRIYYDGDKQQFYEHQPCRGYLSTDDQRAHFGLGGTKQIDSLRIQWADGKSQLITGIQADKPLTIFHKNAKDVFDIYWKEKSQKPLFADASGISGIQYTHEETDVIDYNIQQTLPHKLSQYGPGIAVGDIDNNGFDDFYIGGSAGKPGIFFMQDAGGKFTKSNRILNEPLKEEEDNGVLLFDADGDGDLDLYAVSGSYEFEKGHTASQDRLYINNGKGFFSKSFNALPIEYSNGSCVRAADFDSDGDLDLFVGGRVVSGEYPLAPESFLFRNDQGKFTDVTDQLCPELKHAGMITDALWSDFDRDGKPDLIIAGEWMPVSFYKNTGSGFTNVTQQSGIPGHLGWWNSLVSGDFDNDGDIDYVAGNLGLNSDYKATDNQPMTILAKDIDQNGSTDAMVFCYLRAEDESMQPFPMSTRDDAVAQVISFRKQFPSFKSYGKATMNDLWKEENQKDAIKLKANDMQTSYIENKGNGKFVISPLPLQAQAAPIYGMLSLDTDNDGLLDILMVGNDYGMEPVSGRHDAFSGLMLKGDGKGKFSAVPLPKSGFYVNGDGKGLAMVRTAKNENLLLASQNQDKLKVYKSTNTKNSADKTIRLLPDDFYAEVEYKNGLKRRVEFYYGSTYFSQSSRILNVGDNVKKVVIINFKGAQRTVIQ